MNGPETALTRTDYKRTLDLLADCEGLPNLTEFRGAVTEAFARHFSLRNTTFFVGPIFEDAGHDRFPVATGKATRMMSIYVEKYHRVDPFRKSLLKRPFRPRPMMLDQAMSGPVHPAHRDYVDTFLIRNGIGDMLVIPLVPADPGGSGAVGWLAEESGAFDSRSLAIARLLQQHLTGLFRTHAPEAERSNPLAGLSPRQRQVAELVAEGLTNQKIAESLFIGVDTVKKHLTQVLKTTGCTNRTQLAIRLNPPYPPDR